MLLSPCLSRTVTVEKSKKTAVSHGPDEDGLGLDGERWRKNKGLAPQPCVVAMQAGTERPAGHEQLGARVVVTVRVNRVGERMDVREVTPPRLIVILKPKQKLGPAGRKRASE